MSEIFFDPQNVADFFGEIMKLPHGSAQEDPLRAQVYTWVTDPAYGIGLAPENVFYEPTATAPGSRVIVASRPGTNGHEPIVLQAHLDMVVVTDPPGIDPFPLQPFYDADGWLQARANGAPDVKSSLGADNGIGIAIALALLQDKDLKDYPIECLFTVQEETDMGGAQYFDTALVKSRTMINVDSEEAGIITYGAAGGFKTKYQGTIKRETIRPQPTFVQISLSGLRGGHSGVDIARGRPNALKLLVDGLCRMNQRLSNYTLTPGTLPQSYDFRLVSLVRTDTIKSNAIPGGAMTILAVAENQALALLKSFEEWFNAIRILYDASEQNMKLQLSIAEIPSEEPLTTDSTDNLLCFLRHVPQGPIGLIPGYDPAVVETSSNLYEVSLTGTMVMVKTFSRTSNAVLLGSVDDHCQSPLMQMYRCLGTLYGLTVTNAIEWSPAWPPNKDSPLLATAEKVYATEYPGYRVEVVHAGLECGWFATRYTDMDCISVGPTYQNGHSVDERLDTSSVQGFYDAVKGVLLAQFQEQTRTGSAQTVLTA